MKNKILTLSSYFFFVPSLYIILTKRRFDDYLAFHAAQAFILWVILFTLYILIVEIRYNLVIITSLWVFISALGCVTIIKTKLRIPGVSRAAEKLVN